MQSTTLQNVAPDSEILAISSQTHGGVKDLLRLLRRVVEDFRAQEAMKTAEEVEDGETTVISLESEGLTEEWRVERENDIFIVYGEKIEKFAIRTNFDQYEAVNRLRDIMRKMGIYHELVRRGAEGDSIVRIGDDEFTLTEQ